MWFRLVSFWYPDGIPGVTFEYPVGSLLAPFGIPAVPQPFAQAGNKKALRGEGFFYG